MNEIVELILAQNLLSAKGKIFEALEEIKTRKLVEMKKMTAAKMFEQAQPIQEISDKLRARYVEKGAQSAGKLAAQASKFQHTNKKRSDDLWDKSAKRMNSVTKQIKKVPGSLKDKIRTHREVMNDIKGKK
jgi:hypothetical protein